MPFCKKTLLPSFWQLACNFSKFNKTNRTNASDFCRGVFLFAFSVRVFCRRSLPRLLRLSACVFLFRFLSGGFCIFCPDFLFGDIFYYDRAFYTLFSPFWRVFCRVVFSPSELFGLSEERIALVLVLWRGRLNFSLASRILYDFFVAMRALFCEKQPSGVRGARLGLCFFDNLMCDFAFFR